MELKIDKVTRLKWMGYSDDFQHTPYSELLEFINLQAWHFDSLSFKQKPQTTTHRSYTATVGKHVSHVTRGNHPLGTCSKFQDMP